MKSERTSEIRGLGFVLNSLEPKNLDEAWSGC